MLRPKFVERLLFTSRGRLRLALPVDRQYLMTSVKKGIKRRARTPTLRSKSARFGLAFWPNVKKVPNGRVQGLDLGEIGFRDFPFRVYKSRK